MLKSQQRRRALKAVSPLVAAVLLIAATMSIAGILAYWASSFVRTSLPEVNKTQQECQFIDFRIATCRYDSTNNAIVLIVDNFRAVDIKSPTVTVFDAAGLPQSQVTLNESVPSGQFKAYSVSYPDGNFTKVVVGTAFCPEIKKEVSCEKV
ncbi:MAG TPA: hypothetical protein VJJ76_01520 [archaeon]|nr:hypothetical protein [archaeon]